MGWGDVGGGGRRIPGVIAAAMAMVLVSPVGGNAQTTEAARAVEARERAFAQTMADRDLEAFGTFISPEAVFFNGNEPIRGRDAVIRAWTPFFEGDTAPFSWEPDVVEVLESGGLALSSGPVLDPEGSQAGRFNSVWRLESDGEWYVVFDKGS